MFLTCFSFCINGIYGVDEKSGHLNFARIFLFKLFHQFLHFSCFVTRKFSKFYLDFLFFPLLAFKDQKIDRKHDSIEYNYLGFEPLTISFSIQNDLFLSIHKICVPLLILGKFQLNKSFYITIRALKTKRNRSTKF